MKYNVLVNKFKLYLIPSYAKVLAWQLTDHQRVSSCMLLGSKSNQNELIHLILTNFQGHVDIFSTPNLDDKDLKSKISNDVIRGNQRIFIIPDLSRITTIGQVWLNEFMHRQELNNGVFHDKVYNVKLIFTSVFNDEKSLKKANKIIPCVFNQLYLERRLRKIATIKSDLVNNITAYIDCN